MRESGEMYLETILTLSKRLPFVRSIDVAEEMRFSKASVSRAMGLLREDDYILIDEDGHITLTQRGLETAQKIYERHSVLTSVLVELGVDEEIAMQDACRIEHVISDTSFEKIKQHLNRTGHSRG